MKLLHPDINSYLDSETGIYNLIIENKKFFRDCVVNLKNQEEGEEGKFILQSTKGELVEPSSHLHIITDPFSISLNQKNILNKVIKNLEEEINLSSYETNLKETIDCLSTYIKYAGNSLGINLEFQKNNLNSILHALDIRVQIYDQTNLLGQLLDYMMFTCKSEEDVFILVNLHSLFTPEEIECFLYDCRIKELQIFFIENCAYSHISPATSIIIDEDLCEL